MASSTAEVVSSIGKMQKQCSQIQYGSDQFGRKEYDPAVANPLAQVAIQMKLLMDAPEQLWSALEENNFFSAAQVRWLRGLDLGHVPYAGRSLGALPHPVCAS